MGAISETSDTPFNPHGEKTSDGVVITLGMRVLDYDRRSAPSWPIGTRRSTRAPAHPDYRFPDNTVHGATTGGTQPTHWFDVKHDDSDTVGMFDGSRMQSIPEPYENTALKYTRI